MIEPYKGRVYDPCCGSGGMFVQSEKFVEAHGGKKGDISIYGQESNPTTWRLCNMNLVIRGIEINIGPHHADSFRQDIHNDKSDYRDIPGFCKSASTEEIKAHGYVLTPGRYVGAEDVEDDDEPFDEKMKRLTAKLEEQFAESARLEKAIKRNLKGLGNEL